MLAAQLSQCAEHVDRAYLIMGVLGLAMVAFVFFLARQESEP